MKNINKGILLLMTTFLLFTGCGNMIPNKTTKQQTVTSINLAGTEWNLTMGKTYKGKKESKVSFYEDGKFSNHNPKDPTPDNEIWAVTGNQITFSFNNQFATYIGTISNDGNQISGKASNKNGLKWKWTANKTKSR